MPRTEVEFKVRLEDKKSKDYFHQKLLSLFHLKLVETRHLESDFLFSLPGDLKLRARYWQEFYQNSTKLNIKKIITLKLPRDRQRRVVDNNEYEFDLSEETWNELPYDENYTFIKKMIDEKCLLKSNLLFKKWIRSLYLVKDIFHFERVFKLLYPRSRFSIHDKIRILYTTEFEGEEIEICVDKLPLSRNTQENVYYFEFACHCHRTSRKLQRFLKENMMVKKFDKRGYGKILRDENIDFRFKIIASKEPK